MTDLARIPTSQLRAELAARQTPDMPRTAALEYTDWLAKIAPRHTVHPFADHHRQFWEWADNVHTTIELTRFCLLLWPRGHAKSTSIELAATKWGSEGRARYVLYVCATQELADDHVSNIAALLESPVMERLYPSMAKPMVGKHGNSKGWRRNRVRTSSGFTVDAIGLDTAARGVKLEEDRPNVIILDDIDSEADSPRLVDKKVRTLTQSILPAGTDDAIVVLAQNLTHPNAIAKKLDDSTVDMLNGALKIGPVPAVENMSVEQDEQGIWRITDGEPTWSGMNLADCEDRILRYGLSAFLLESQQQITDRRGALWTQRLIDDSRKPLPVNVDRVIVAIDPNKTGRGDDAGIVCLARATIPGQALPHAFVIEDATELVAPSEWRDIAAAMLLHRQAGSFVIERTGSGELAELTLRGAPLLQGHPVEVINVEAKMSKADRARPVAQLYKDGRVHHCDVFPTLEGQMTGWLPSSSSMSPGGVDALVHGLTHLLIEVSEPVPEEWSASPEWAVSAGPIVRP